VESPLLLEEKTEGTTDPEQLSKIYVDPTMIVQVIPTGGKKGSIVKKVPKLVREKHITLTIENQDTH
jgi:hypothetical protein